MLTYPTIEEQLASLGIRLDLRDDGRLELTTKEDGGEPLVGEPDQPPAAQLMPLKERSRHDFKDTKRCDCGPLLEQRLDPLYPSGGRRSTRQAERGHGARVRSSERHAAGAGRPPLRGPR